MLYVVETRKDVETAARDLEAAVRRNKFGVLHAYDLQRTPRGKGVDLADEVERGTKRMIDEVK
ncbi:MAG TPA: hypothetical protein VN648_06950 [Candidatus Methylomirabilis sp.]|nr:hypothetical protein [Candidatus Methylomirabilis sp.]